MSHTFTHVDPRPSWEEWALGIATAVASRADCTRRQVGAVILEEGTRHVLSVGYNGLPAGLDGCMTAGACPRGQLSPEALAPDSAYTGPGVAAPCHALHAEENALLHADLQRARGGVMAVTCRPCAGCERLLRGSALSRVFWNDYNPEATAGGQTAPILRVMYL